MSPSKDYNETIEVSGEEAIKLDEKHTFMQEQWQILRIGFPAVVSCLISEVPNLVNLVYAGQMNNGARVAGLGLGISLVESITFSVFFGMNGAIETLAAQAFGAKELSLCGVYLNRARVINTVVFLPLAFILLQSGFILRALG